jgi:two-component system, NarL family, response regulator LiaR
VKRQPEIPVDGTESDQDASEIALRAVVADDDPFARQVIKDALQRGGVQVIAEARNGRQAIELTLYHRPDVVLMDVVMPSLDGVLATREVLRADPDQLVVVLTSAGEEEFGLLALEAGAVGFLSKDLDIDALPRALMAVGEGQAAISRAMTRRVLGRFRQVSDGSPRLRPIGGPLTPREWEVIDVLRPGLSTDEVAEVLVISDETVRSHIKNILRKLNVHSRAEALAATDALRMHASD